ncbi:Transglutaminase-like enzyme, putative cysteine protease [Verrucomicrobium sp. GAS474]|nr:Transglutaminase-like enzyme, putative cysteine protease [Verrucomicrobium sp. GAS474]
MTVRVGCRLVYEAPLPTPILLLIRPRLERPHRILREKLSIPSVRKSDAARDANGNITHRWTLPPGRTTIVHDALVEISSRPDNFEPKTHSVPVAELSLDILRYTLPSRYCDSDKMLRFAATQFGHLINGIDRVIAICNWTHRNIRYVTCSGRPDLSASEVMARGYGVCRDFAHVAIALCRAVNLPARYVSGHMPDIGFRDAGGAMDFHAYFEVYLEHQWRPFDARFNIPRIGRIKISHGLDAVDGSFATTYGEAQLTFFEVWAYQVKPGTVSLGDPIDLSKRLDGTPRIRFR